jgi:hypothetical protein
VGDAVSGVQNSQNMFLGTDDRPYVTIDGLPFPLVPGSQVEVSPLNPFSPSNVDGNSTAVLSQRHATQVWDDFTGGLGYRDDEPDSHHYAYGNLDARVPGALTVPHKANELGSGAAAALPYTVTAVANYEPVRADFVGDGSGWAFLTWKWGWFGNSGLVRRVTSAGVATVGISDAEFVWGTAAWLGNQYILTMTAGNQAKLYKSSGTSQTMAFALVGAATAGSHLGLVVFDDKLITYDAAAKNFKQWNSSTLVWDAYIGGYTDISGTGETIRQLFVWTDKSGSTDALYAMTEWRIMVYDEQGQQWETLYAFGDLFAPYEAMAHVNRRDNSLVVSTSTLVATPTATSLVTGTILIFNPGSVDNIGINKGFGFPNNSAYNSLGTVAPVNLPATLASGIHWLYAWCYAPTGLGAGIQGGVYAFNEFGGWTQVFDPCAVRVNTTASVIGGGYGSGKLLTILTDGSYYVQSEFDANLNPPFGTYDDATAGTHTYYLQSGRVWNKQKNVLKLGSHFEVTFQDVIPANCTVQLLYRWYDENGLTAFRGSGAFPTGKKRVSVNLTDGSGSNGIHYYYLEWQLQITLTAGATAPPVVQFIVLNYTYWQDAHFSYQFAVDLTRETWATWYPDGGMPNAVGTGLYQREGLQQYIIQTLMNSRGYHTFSYVLTNSNFQEAVAKADILVSRRESADDESGVYLFTVRDLEADMPPSGGAGTTHSIL